MKTFLGGESMKKIWLFLLVLLLTGCSAEPVYETLPDMPAEPVMAAVRDVFVQPPEDAIAQTSGQEDLQIYMGDGYTLILQTLPGGDLNETVQQVTGYNQSQLQLTESQKGDARRFDFVWTGTGEEELELGRGCILDDGNYHYVLCAMTPESHTEDLQHILRPVFASFRLAEGDWQLNTGS